jgi:hypothetical protein
MHQWISTIASGPGQAWAAMLMAAAAVRVPPPRKKRLDAQLDDRTLKDLGVEPGSITWM